jgi:hypothetical protein
MMVLPSIRSLSFARKGGRHNRERGQGSVGFDEYLIALDFGFAWSSGFS